MAVKQKDIPTAIAEFRAQTVLPEVFTVSTNVEAQDAGIVLRNIKTGQKRLKALKETMTVPMRDALNAANALFAPEEQRLISLENSLKRAVNGFLQEQDRKRRLEEARLRDEQAKEAARLEQRAASLRARGKEEQAEAVLDTIPSVPVVLANTDKIEGVSQRSTWKAEVYDFCKLLAAVALGELPEEFVQVNQTALNAYARTNQGTVSIPGVRMYEEKGLAVRGN